MEDLGALTWRWCLSLGWGVAALPDSMALPASPCKLRGWGLLLSRGGPFPLPAPPPPWPHLETRCHWPSGQGRSPWAGQQHLGRVCDRKGGKGCHPIRAPRAQEFFFSTWPVLGRGGKRTREQPKGLDFVGFPGSWGAFHGGHREQASRDTCSALAAGLACPSRAILEDGVGNSVLEEQWNVPECSRSCLQTWPRSLAHSSGCGKQGGGDKPLFLSAPTFYFIYNSGGV